MEGKNVMSGTQHNLKTAKSAGSRRDKIIRWVVIIVAAFVIFRITTIIIGKTLLKEKAKGDLQPILVTSSVATKGTIKEILYLNGNVKGSSEVQIFPKVPGKLYKVIKQEGEFVNEGEVIALVDRDTPGTYEKAQIVASISGTIAKIFADVGGSVSPMQPLVYIAKMDKILVNVEIAAIDVHKVKPGMEAEIILDEYPDRIFIGTVKTVSQWLNPATRSASVKIEIDNKDHLLIPGMYARVKIITTKHENVIYIPVTAMLEREGEKVVFTIDQNSRAIIKKVKTGIANDDYVEIESGIQEGEIVVVNGNYALVDKSLVEVEK
ncbi:MAG TPA: efflux RND transporter periplasmic adaptor subunit [Candidatus Goldiibacteriota bacterium]|nr:efflux RND transporter periplasmic adaptor subunit [Candidatus Goldiibacteriota bacterium]